MRNEPVLVLLAGLAAVVNLGLAAAVKLGWLVLDAGQIAAVVAFVTAACGLAAAVIRSKVSPA
jgi:hypothetical protein